MTIHLSKHWLGETERSLVEMTGRDGGPVAVQHPIVIVRHIVDPLDDQSSAAGAPLIEARPVPAEDDDD